MRIGALAAALIAAGVLAVPTPASADVTGGSCAWFATLSTNGANALALDQDVTYWVTRVPYLPGETLTLKGQYPHARYFSVTAYDPRTRAVSSLYDAQIQPDPGSSNPYAPGAPRNDPHRSYTLQVVFLLPGQPPSAAPNVLSTGFSAGATVPATDYFLVYRVYSPDKGLDATGGTGLPSVTANVPVTGGATFPACPAGYQPPSTINDELAGAAAPASPPPNPNQPNPVWHKFYNAPTSATQSPDSTGQTNFSGTAGPYTMKTGAGGYLEDRENAYLYTFANSGGPGPLIVIRAQALTYANTFDHAPTMPGGTDVRYWSICTYDPATQRNYACQADYEAAPTSSSYTVVISTPANKPANLCGATWLPFGPNLQALVIFRNLLGTAPYTAQNVQLGQETAMGAYYPTARYMDQPTYLSDVCGIKPAQTPAPAEPPPAADNSSGAGGDSSAPGYDGAATSDFGGYGSYGGLGAIEVDGVAGMGIGDSADAALQADTSDQPELDATPAGLLLKPAPLPSGNLPLGLSLAALVVVGLSALIRARLVSQ